MKILLSTYYVHIDKESSAAEKEVGDSLGKVWVTAYCSCSQCCGSYANGITASGTTVHNLTYEDYIKNGTLTKEQEEMLTDMMDSDLWE